MLAIDMLGIDRILVIAPRRKQDVYGP